MRFTRSLCILAASAAALAQTPPVTTLEVTVENLVQYSDDITDPTKTATSPVVVPWPSNQ